MSTEITDLDEFLAELGESSVRLRVYGDRIIVKDGDLTPEQRANLKRHRQAVIDYCTPKHPHITKRWVPRVRLSLSFYDEENEDEERTGYKAARDIMHDNFICDPKETEKYQIVKTPIEQVEVRVVYDGNTANPVIEHFADDLYAINHIRECEEQACSGVCGNIPRAQRRFNLCKACDDAMDPHIWSIERRKKGAKKWRPFKVRIPYSRAWETLTNCNLENATECVADDSLVNVARMELMENAHNDWRIVNQRTGEAFTIVYSVREKLEADEHWYEEWVEPLLEKGKRQKPGQFVPCIGQLWLSVDEGKKTLNITLEPMPCEVAMHAARVQRTEHTRWRADAPTSCRIRGLVTKGDGSLSEELIQGELIDPYKDEES